nr:mediator of rna polymerase ii transcription subunit 18 [Quercus suber]
MENVRTKMQEYVLYTIIPARRHDQTLNILAGMTAMQPVPICEQHLVYAQLKHHTEKGTAKKITSKSGIQANNNKPLLYRHLIRSLSFACECQDGSGAWRLRAEDIPEAGSKIVISRSVIDEAITDAGLETFRGGSEDNKYRNQFILRGHRFIHQNIIIRVYRICWVAEGHGALEPLDAPLPLLSECRAVDPSGSYMIDAFIRFEDATNSKLAEQAIKEIIAFKSSLDGALDLHAPKRLALDSRVKG